MLIFYFVFLRQEEEIFNVWTAYLNLEFNFGSSESLKAVFDRAIRNSDAFKMHKQLLKIYQGAGRVKESDELLEDMLKRFRHGSLDVWFLYGQHLMDTGRPEKARQLMKKATTSVEKQNHVFLLSRFAQMEYKSGDPEQGKTIFESILNAYPKKADIWSVYIDMVTRRRNVDETRRLFERVTSNKFSTHKMRSFFKKWLDFEKKFGDDEHQNMVKERAVDLIDVATKELGLD
ncbi:hypothetical protein AB6A40_009853 [Gnathostoma spinigerum]|uniref:Suppressor of forked domain-containing protein n=1 Tax=Gnathostoma spinigerum TaxID=75299 RepID=A0ABD6ET46_9BILA